MIKFGDYVSICIQKVYELVITFGEMFQCGSSAYILGFIDDYNIIHKPCFAPYLDRLQVLKNVGALLKWHELKLITKGRSLYQPTDPLGFTTETSFVHQS